jgi:hypothetical protein
MTEFIAHRINKIDELKTIPSQYGIEIDLRPQNNKIILEHDAFFDETKDDFEEFLKNYHHQTLILNIKSEGIEIKCLELLKKYHIKKYFFLDCSFPMIVKLSNLGEKNIALRFSEYEGLDTIKSMIGKVDWIWIDCFSQLPISQKEFDFFKENNFKICLVSPELQGQESKISLYKKYLKEQNIIFDAICCKHYNIKLWK